MKTIKEYPSQETLQELFEYREGQLFWKKHYHPKCVGKRAGGLEVKGYRSVAIDSKRYKEHRLVYILLKGSIPEGMTIDHINGCKDDNRIENLRILTNKENCKSKGMHLKGKKPYSCYVSEEKSKFVVRARDLNRFHRYYGSYKTPQEAQEVASFVDSGGLDFVLSTYILSRMNYENGR